MNTSIRQIVVVVCHAEVTMLCQPLAGLCHISVPIGSVNANRKKPLKSSGELPSGHFLQQLEPHILPL